MNDLIYIKSIGNFLATYESDLYFIQKFQDFKNGSISIESYHKKTEGMFLSFISEYRVARNIPTGKREAFLKELKKFISVDDSDVDLFARKMKIKGLTGKKLCVSLCSKVLFLCNPCEVLPIDFMARRALGYGENNYSEFKNHLNVYREKHQIDLNKHLDEVLHFTKKIELKYKNKIENLETIRENRFLDKVLWTIGKSQ